MVTVRDRSLPASVRCIPLIAALVAFVLHLVGNPHYGFYGDELYFIICGRHPAFGYVDQPSLTPLVSAFSQAFGPSLFALRAIPAACAAAATYVSCSFVFELGGGTFAALIAAIATTLSPVLLSLGARSSPDMFELWTWPLAALLVVRMSKGASPRLWLVVGALVALAAWSKYSVGFFVVGMLVGLALTPMRRLMFTRWFAYGFALAVLLILPNVMWQAANGYPMLQVLHNDYGKYVINVPYVFQQIMVMHPALSVVWIFGALWLLGKPELRWMGYAFLIVLGAMATLNAKLYYPAAIYPYLFSAGAVALEQLTALRPRWRRALAAVMLAVVVPFLPFTLPILPLPTYIAYQNAFHHVFGVRFSLPTDSRKNVPMQLYADMTGWPQMVAAIADVYHRLPPQQRREAVIYTRDFSEASAVNFFGGMYGLPEAVSGNNNYWIWGPGKRSGQVFIDVNGDAARDRKFFSRVRLATVYDNPHAMPYEDNVKILICEGGRIQLAALWPRLRHYGYALSSASDTWTER